MTLRIAFVEGATPDKWARHWRDREQEAIELLPVLPHEQRPVLDEDRADMLLGRLPFPAEDLHCIRLYEELTVVVVDLEHPVAAYDEVDAADLTGEQFVLGVPPGIAAEAEQLPFPRMQAREAIEAAASGTGVVVLPMSVARLHHRKDVVHRVVRDLPPTQVVLAWRKDRDDERTQRFVGVVRGRTARSSRG